MIWLIQVFIAALMTKLCYLVSFSIGKAESNYQAYFSTYGAMVAFCMILCVILNLILFWILRTSRSNFNSLVFEKHKKASNRLLIINLVYIICSVPLVIVTFMVVEKISQEIDKTQESAMTLVNYFIAKYWSFDIYVLYSGLNAVIYVGFDQKIIAFYKNCYCRICC